MTLRYAHMGDWETPLAAERIGTAIAAALAGSVNLAANGQRQPISGDEHGADPRIHATRFPTVCPHDMVIDVKATLEIDDSVMERLREEAPRRGTTVSALVEAGLRYVLGKDAPTEHPVGDLPTLPSWDSGGHLVDINNREELYRVMEEG